MEKYKLAVSAFFGTAAFLFGGWDGLMTVLLACIVIDYISGVICAAYEKKLSSRIGARGIAKKIMIFLGRQPAYPDRAFLHCERKHFYPRKLRKAGRSRAEAADGYAYQAEGKGGKR